MPPIQIKGNNSPGHCQQHHVISCQPSSFFLVLSLFCDICIAPVKHIGKESLSRQWILQIALAFLLACSNLLFISHKAMAKDVIFSSISFFVPSVESVMKP